VSLTVTQFRSLTSLENNRYVDATISLAPHSTVKLEHREGMPAFICKEPANFEITLASANPNESFIPLAVTFQQQGSITGAKRDNSGAVNFERLATPAGKLLFRTNGSLKETKANMRFCAHSKTIRRCDRPD
jgi:hypothetical protein